MADSTVTPGTWVQVVDAHLHVMAATPPADRGAVELVAEAVATADAALVEVARRDPDPFGCPAGAALACGAAFGCYQEAADWPVFDLPLPALFGYDQIPTAERVDWRPAADRRCPRRHARPRPRRSRSTRRAAAGRRCRCVDPSAALRRPRRALSAVGCRCSARSNPEQR